MWDHKRIFYLIWCVYVYISLYINKESGFFRNRAPTCTDFNLTEMDPSRNETELTQGIRNRSKRDNILPTMKRHVSH
ncbi:hypothetical protein Hanom_Chr12g01129021 [Helianthus anomalus]